MSSSNMLITAGVFTRDRDNQWDTRVIHRAAANGGTCTTRQSKYQSDRHDVCSSRISHSSLSLSLTSNNIANGWDSCLPCPGNTSESHPIAPSESPSRILPPYRVTNPESITCDWEDLSDGWGRKRSLGIQSPYTLSLTSQTDWLKGMKRDPPNF